MARRIPIMAVILLVAPLLSAAQPLSESQQARLATADDGSPTIDEAAFYALLENVSGEPITKAGAVIPDYAAIRSKPADHRGDMVYIEGRLLTTWGKLNEPINLAREGHEKVRGLIVQIDHFDQTPKADDVVIVFLTDPPPLEAAEWQTESGLLKQSRATITLAARFFKVLNEPSRGGKPREYLVFVGHGAEIGELASGMAPSVRNTIIFAVGIAALLIYWFWRVATIRRRRSGKATQVEAYRLRKEQRRRERAGEDDTGDATYEEPENLPEDPIEAMEVLKQRHAEAHPPVFTLDNDGRGDDDVDPSEPSDDPERS